MCHFFLPAEAFDTVGKRAATGDSAVTHQLRNVLRLKTGSRVRLLDGLGNMWLSSVEQFGKNDVIFSLEQKLAEQPTNATPFEIVSILPLIKAHRFEWALEKLTELGVDRICPVATTRCVVKLKDDQEGKARRWQHIVKEAAEQCERLFLPTIDKARTLSDLLANIGSDESDKSDTSGSERRLWLSERSEAPDMVQYLSAQSLGNEPAESARRLTRIMLISGPEGGFSDEEKEAIAAHHFQPVTLGKSILRSETAAIFAVGIAKTIARTLD